jgi:hypothetical protein
MAWGLSLPIYIIYNSDETMKRDGSHKTNIERFCINLLCTQPTKDFSETFMKIII